MKNVYPPPHHSHKKVRTTIFATASIVTALSIAERGLGFLYRIVLSRLLGAEGVGIYQVALSLFSVFLTIGTGGIPITVSRLICKSKAQNNVTGERRAVSAGFLLSFVLTAPVVLILGFFPSAVSFLFTDKQGVQVFRILLLGLIFSSLYAVIRGYFWGNKQLLLPSVLEIAEETVMVIAGVLLLQNVVSVQQGANKAAWAVVISYLFSFTTSIVCFVVCGGKLATPKKTLKPLFSAALPLTSVRASGSLVNSAVAVLLPVMLVRAGFQESEALQLFGIVSGMAIPVLFIPATIIGSIALVLVPELSEDFYRHNTERLHKNLARGLCVSMLVAIFLIPFFYVLGDDLGLLAFSNPLAGDFIRKGSVVLLPMSLTMISTGMLNSMGFERQTFVFYFIGAAVLLLCILLLPAVCGAYAYVIGLGASYICNSVCNLVLLGRKCPKLYKQMQKRGEQGCIHYVYRAILPAFAICIIGNFFVALYNTFFGQFWTTLFTGATIALLTVSVWIVLDIIPFRLPKRKKRRFPEKI